MSEERIVTSSVESREDTMLFETLTGFSEDRIDSVAAQFVVDGSTNTSRPDNRTMRFRP